jgi:hypothetical protein
MWGLKADYVANRRAVYYILQILCYRNLHQEYAPRVILLLLSFDSYCTFQFTIILIDSQD